MTRPAHPWLPSSPCDAGCLPASGSVPQVGRVRRALRLAACAGVLLVGIVLVPVLRIAPAGARGALVGGWFRLLLTALAVRLRVRGGVRYAPGRQPVLVVGNHTSWLDIVALNAVAPLRMVAKSEIAGWPVIGWLAAAAGTVFVERERLSRLPGTLATITDALRGGAQVGAFPEATTWCGAASGRFRPAVFQAALDAGAAVRPVALRYRVGAGPTTVASFVGAADLWHSVRAVAGARGMVIEAVLLPVLAPVATTRRELAVAAQAAVAAVTGPSARTRTGEPITLWFDDLPRPCGNHAHARLGDRGDDRGPGEPRQCVVAAQLGSPGAAGR